MPAPCCVRFWEKMSKTDEPVFTLVAHDKLAPAVLEAWIRAAEEAGVNEAKVQKGRDHLAAIMAWQQANPDGVKLPD